MRKSTGKQGDDSQHRPDRLQDVETKAWQMIHHGALSGKNPMHYLFVATQGKEGPSLRTVVLRSADPTHRTLHFHTDRRSQKWREMMNNPAISMVLYHHPEKTQLRMGGIATLHTDDSVADDAWANTILSSRRIYLATKPPSSISDHPDSGLPPNFEDRLPNEAESEAGRANFCVVSVRIISLDWLNLHSQGHRRARFLYDDSGNISDQHWLIP